MVRTDGTVYRFITDHLGSVRLVVNAETGEVVQRNGHLGTWIDHESAGEVGNNALQFGDVPWLPDDVAGLAIGNVIFYQSPNPS